MRLLVVEQGINLGVRIHSNQPVNQILWSKMRGCDKEYSSYSYTKENCTYIYIYTYINEVGEKL